MAKLCKAALRGTGDFTKWQSNPRRAPQCFCCSGVPYTELMQIRGLGRWYMQLPAFRAFAGERSDRKLCHDLFLQSKPKRPLNRKPRYTRISYPTDSVPGSWASSARNSRLSGPAGLWVLMLVGMFLGQQLGLWKSQGVRVGDFQTGGKLSLPSSSRFEG